jgi:hypothetical protein
LTQPLLIRGNANSLRGVGVSRREISSLSLQNGL